MKSSRLILLLSILTLACGWTAPTARAQEKKEPVTVTQAECEEIFVIVGPRWALRLKKDGSGQLNHGKKEDFHLPKGTFDLAKVYQELQAAPALTDDSGNSVVFVKTNPMGAAKKRIAPKSDCLRNLRQTTESAIAREDAARYQQTKAANPFEE